ncbi:MAG: hypothetical protein RLY20_3357 [Verrucomicrobiota bacterium]|jgi:hypothetical protein
MTDSATLSRTQLLSGLCVAVAALVGFVIADPLRYSSLMVLGGLAGLMLWPFVVKWHRILLVATVHSAFVMGYLPGDLPMWCGFAAVGFFIVILQRCLSRDVTLVHPGGVGWALIALVAVVILTAWYRGGVGLKSIGSESYGGKKYVLLLLGVASYFVLSAHPIPRRRVWLYLAMFFLSSLTGLLSHAIFMAGSKFYWMFKFISVDAAYSQAQFQWQIAGDNVFRSLAFSEAAGGIIGFVLAFKGLRGILNIRQPWYLLLVLVCLAVGTIGGFRSFLMGMLVIGGTIFLLEGLHKTRLILLVLAIFALISVGLVAYSDKLPISVQRSLTFLPLKLDAWVRQEAQGSLDWRIEMWDYLNKEVPANLVVGKGYAIDPDAMRMSMFNSSYDYGPKSEWAMLTGEYHNGPLSVVIPFGIWGVVAFLWFLTAGAMRLHWHYRNCDPDMVTINRVLFALFLARIAFFIFLIGSLYSGLVEFAFLAGLGEALNMRKPAAQESTEQTAESPELVESETL